MSNNYKSSLIICPSLVMARGLESILCNLGEFKVSAILTDLSRTSEGRLKNIDPELIIIDPVILDFNSRHDGRNILNQYNNAAIVAFPSVMMDEESLKHYDEVLNIYDEPTTIVRKLRTAIEARQESPKNGDEELSSRERDVLICVAKGMLNKEIADKFGISIYTVITHRKNISRKTGIRTVAGLTVYALLNNLIDINEFE